MSQVQLNLEDKIRRLKEIQSQLEAKQIPLSQSIGLLEEAYELKKDIEKELKAMENKLVKLSQDDNKNYQSVV